MSGDNKMKICRISTILKHINGYGFKITFNTPEEAKEYKNMNDVIINMMVTGFITKKEFMKKRNKIL